MHDADHKTETVRAGRRVAALMRHGHFPRSENTASAHLTLPLSDEGREQSEVAADALLGFASANGLVIDPYVESSPLLRAHETATVVVDALKRRTGTAFDITNRDELIERGALSLENVVNVSMEFAQIVLFEINSDGHWVQLAGGWNKRMPAAQGPKSKAALDRANHEPAL